eukprot:3012326-Pleurochrysis_carterae.AAC.1
MHEQVDGCLAAQRSLGDNSGTVKKDEAAWRRYWVLLTELLGVAKWRENPVTPVAILREAFLLCKILLLVLATMPAARCGSQACLRLQCSQAASEGAPESGKGNDQGQTLASCSRWPGSAVCYPARS